MRTTIGQTVDINITVVTVFTFNKSSTENMVGGGRHHGWSASLRWPARCAPAHRHRFFTGSRVHDKNRLKGYASRAIDSYDCIYLWWHGTPGLLRNSLRPPAAVFDNAATSSAVPEAAADWSIVRPTVEL